MTTVRRGRRVLCLVAAVAAGLAGLAGCGGASSTGAGTTLTMWTFKQTHVKALQDAAASFKAKTGISVTITAYTPDDTYTSKVQSAAATHSLPDVLEVHAAGEDFTFGAAGLLTDLTPDVDAAWKSRFLSGTADAGLVTEQIYQASRNPKSTHDGVKQGQLFSIPFTAGTFGVVYANKAKLKAAGLDPSAPPKTWEQLLSWFRATDIKDPVDGGVTLGLSDSSTGLDWLMEPLAYSYLGKARYQALFGQNSAQDWGSPTGAQVLSLYNEITPYWSPGDQTLSIDNADLAFAQGKSAFDVGGTFTMASLQQDGMDPNNVVALGLPSAANGAVNDLKLAPTALTGLAISSQTKNSGAALQWLNYLTTEAQAGKFAQTSFDLPATNLGANASKDVGPYLSSLEAVFGTGDNAFNSADNTFQSPTWDIQKAGDIVIKMSPLKQASAATVNTQLGAYNTDSWK
ncbi:MAG TPA: extracellular solute-binding protein [Pseudonocardiaceae bacterium]|jgi:multiple sugar transport system substrate-binding protein|nr:extracellular solute-binding protein [Pseudonocardiaceae bacterium]